MVKAASNNHNKMTKKPAQQVKTRVVRQPRPYGYPKRPLTAFNIFFRCQRNKLISEEIDEDDDCLALEDLKKKIAFAAAMGTRSGKKRSHRKTHGKISFGDLGRIIATRWKNIDPQIKKLYEAQAEEESNKYRIAVSKFQEAIVAENCMSKNDTVQSSAYQDVLSSPKPDQTESAFHTSKAKLLIDSLSKYQETNFARMGPHLLSQVNTSMYSSATLPSILSEKGTYSNGASSDDLLLKVNPDGIIGSKYKLSNVLNSIYNTGASAHRSDVSLPSHIVTNSLDAGNSPAFVNIENNARSILADSSRRSSEQGQSSINDRNRSLLQAYQFRTLVEVLEKGRQPNLAVGSGAIPSSPYPSKTISGLNSTSLGLMRSDINQIGDNFNGSLNRLSSATTPFEIHQYIARLQELKRISNMAKQEKDLALFIQNYLSLR